VEIPEGIMQRVRQSADALEQLAVGFPAGEYRRAVTEVLRLLGRGWIIDDG
jgi:hypothetical protein